MQQSGISVKSPCVGSFSIKEIVAFAIVVFTLIFNGAFIFYQIKDLPEKVSKNSADISVLKGDFIEIKTKQTIMHDDIKEVRKDIKLLLRKK